MRGLRILVDALVLTSIAITLYGLLLVAGAVFGQ